MYILHKDKVMCIHVHVDGCCNDKVMYICICFFPQTGVKEAFSREEEELRVESASEYTNFNKWFLKLILIIIF